MRNFLSWWIILLSGWPLVATGQGFYGHELPVRVQEVPVYQTAGPHVEITMAFAESRVRGAAADTLPPGMQVAAVDLVLTRYPIDLDAWEINYDTLMENRFAALRKLLPEAFATPNVRWRIIRQTQCRDLASAQRMFHGFAVYYGPRTAPPATVDLDATAARPPRFDTTELREGLDEALALLDGTETFYDSTALEVLGRHPEWRDMVIVSDWTASMYRYGAQTIRHIRQSEDRDRVQGYVLFNDGDGKYDDEKVAGLTGGVYHARAGHAREVMVAVRGVLMGCHGGDHRENDIEALISAQERYPVASELILIADNRGPIRDLELLEYIDRPVRVILCGAYKNDIEPDYFTLAYQSGGSLHLRDQDFDDWDNLLGRGQFRLGDYEYTLRRGRIVQKEIR